MSGVKVTHRLELFKCVNCKKTEAVKLNGRTSVELVCMVVSAGNRKNAGVLLFQVQYLHLMPVVDFCPITSF